jgi:hypothetical protein
MENKCKDCGCQDTFLPVGPCSDPALCPPADKCDNTFDLGCVNYTGEPLTCGGQTLLDTNDSLETGLLNITDKICDSVNNNKAFFDVNFTKPQAKRLVANVSGGIPPYVYEWSIERSNSISGYTIVGSTTTNTLNFTRIEDNISKGSRLSVLPVNYFGSRFKHYFIHLKLKITDNENKIDYKHYLFYESVSGS